MSVHGRGENAADHDDLGRLSDYPQEWEFGSHSNTGIDKEDVGDRSPKIEGWRSFSSTIDNEDSDEEPIQLSKWIQNEYKTKPKDYRMDPPPRPVQRRSAPSPEPSPDSLQPGNNDEPLKLGSSRLVSGGSCGDCKEPSNTSEEESETNIKDTSTKKDSLINDLSSEMAAFEQRAGSPTSLLAYRCDHGNPNYTDLAEPSIAKPLQRRVEAMRARNAQEDYHDRIPAEDAPQHMQMMVLLYQWAAWAFEIPDHQRRKQQINWVNGRFLDFMMSGGHVPGYNLQELLEIAGVDPKELYGYSGELAQQGRTMANMSSSQLAASISGKQAENGIEEAATEENGACFTRENSSTLTAREDLLSGTKQRTGDKSNDEDEDIANVKETLHGCTSGYEGSFVRNSDGPFPAEESAAGYRHDPVVTVDRKRKATSDLNVLDQV